MKSSAGERRTALQPVYKGDVQVGEFRTEPVITNEMYQPQSDLFMYLIDVALRERTYDTGTKN